jgi:hypothetical protein
MASGFPEGCATAAGVSRRMTMENSKVPLRVFKTKLRFGFMIELLLKPGTYRRTMNNGKDSKFKSKIRGKQECVIFY